MISKRGRFFARPAFFFMVLLVSLSIGEEVLAGQGSGIGRKIWDTVMLFFNFGILVFLFLRYAKTPLMDFLRNAQEKIREDLQRVEGELKDAQSAMEAEQEKLKGLNRRLEEIRASILELGRKEKERIIEQAKITAEKMIQDANAYSRYRLHMAKKQLSHEIAETAVSLAEKKLMKGLSEGDHQRQINSFIEALSQSGQEFLK